jgi:RNA binding exosome subunit
VAATVAPAFREVAAEAFVHATESEEAVRRALTFVVPGARVERRGLGGHFGQPLVQLKAATTDRGRVSHAVEVVRRAGGAEVAATAARRLSPDLLLHVRLDKQEASLGRAALGAGGAGDAVVVRFRLRAPRLTFEAAVAVVRGEFGAGERASEE